MTNTLKEKNIAVVGVSSNKEKYGYKIFNDLLNNNYTVTGINPKLDTLLNQKIYPSLSSLSTKPDLVIVVVPPKVALNILKECKKLDIKDIWFQPGVESDEAIKFAKDNNLNLSTNACIMVKQGLW